MSDYLTPENRQNLLDALGDAQRIGMLGERSLDHIIDQSLNFVTAIPAQARTLIDLGSGGGDPGLVIAVARPDLHVTLVDRRAKRTDLLTRLVGRLGLLGRVVVLEAEVSELPQLQAGNYWDIITARGFGAPAYTARHAAPLLASRGLLLVSEPPDSIGDRWLGRDISATGLILQSVSLGVAVLAQTSAPRD